MRRSTSAPPAAVMFWPMTQNTALMSCSARKSSSSRVVAPLGPSSKVSAATFPVPVAAQAGAATGLMAPPGTTDGSDPPPPVDSSVVMRMSST